MSDGPTTVIKLNAEIAALRGVLVAVIAALQHRDAPGIPVSVSLVTALEQWRNGSVQAFAAQAAGEIGGSDAFTHAFAEISDAVLAHSDSPAVLELKR